MSIMIIVQVIKEEKPNNSGRDKNMARKAFLDSVRKIPVAIDNEKINEENLWNEFLALSKRRIIAIGQQILSHEPR